ncbi:putative beta-glucosidase [Candidatus Sulfotelmatomonas gaucii]|uniref:Putative beta-glucosidase n=1 Tax=Candidatus Sulfuritelmatomonas gaucii TaxID=2043161 RepID=A0A2N9L3I3_9BACT|nr:putative beta-glucosidase [Candidatus Sulfotelmatomonas gaucii]
MRYRGRVMEKQLKRSLSAFVLVILAAVSCTGIAAAQAPAPDSPDIEAQAHAMLAKLTLEQKIELLSGIDNMFTRPMPAIDLPRFKMSDASVGVRTWGPTTAYAGGAALAASWDPELARKIGESLGRDARARNVNFLLGPGVNIARSPLNGRNFEYLSEDPFLNSTLVVPFIEGVQSQGVIATVKHYALNNSEFNRHNIDAEVDERTIREIYLPSFEAAVTEGHVDAVMDSYNLVNGVHSTQNDFLNLKVLKSDWGFQGVLMSDWDATYDGVAACNNGLDLEMPSPKFMNAKNLLPAVQSGAVKESTIDEHVLRLLRTELRYGFTTRPQFDPADSTYSVADRTVALQGALESITLLKNQDHLLPLDPAKVKNIAVIGPDAYPAVTGGGGSSEAHAFEPVSILTGIANLHGPDAHVFYSPGMPEDPAEKKAVEQADVVFVAVGFNPKTESEGRDRTFTLPPGQDALIEAAAAANSHTIVLLTAGGGVDTSRWLDKVPAFMLLYYPGQEGGTAVAQILFGQHDPEGKLPVSFDRSWESNPSAKWYYGDPKDNTTLHTTGENDQPKDYTIEHVKYGDKLMVGYRYWTTSGKHPLFPFGFGLSYTTFRFSNLQAPSLATKGTIDPKGIAVSFDVTNTGTVAGAEVAQLYVSDPSAQVDRPERELKGFEKLQLAPGETRHVTLSLDARAFSYWDEPAHKWIIDPGKFVIRVGDSSEHTPLDAAIDLR